MSGNVSITDEELVAYLDGAIDPARRGEIDATIAKDRSLGVRLANLEIDKDALRRAFDAVTAAAPIDRLRTQFDERTARPWLRRGNVRWIAVAVALATGAALGYGIGSNNLASPAKTWHVAIADYQALYTRETLAPVASGPDKQRREVADVAEKLGLAIKFEALQVPGLDFKRAQILSFDGRPLAQFSYVDPSGIPIAFCATHTGDQGSPIRTGMLNGLRAAFWSKNGYGFIVIGPAPAKTLQDAAAVLAEHV